MDVQRKRKLARIVYYTLNVVVALILITLLITTGIGLYIECQKYPVIKEAVKFILILLAGIASMCGFISLYKWAEDNR